MSSKAAKTTAKSTAKLAKADKKEEALKGVNTFLHPKSRKCIAMVKKIKKETKKERAKQETKLKQSLVADKLLWFQKHMDPNICPYTIELTAELIKQYMCRNHEELEQIKIKRSIGQNRNRQHSGREDAIRMTKERERNDYESCGFEIPNILNATQCALLKKWDGDLKFLPNLKLTKFKKRFLDEELKQKENKVITKPVVDTKQISEPQNSEVSVGMDVE